MYRPQNGWQAVQSSVAGAGQGAGSHVGPHRADGQIADVNVVGR